MKTIFQTILVALAADTAFGAIPFCASLDNATRISAAVSSTASACFQLTVIAGEPVQLVAEQPVDLEIRATTGHLTSKFDAFEFGRETATFTGAGKYEITVRAVEGSVDVPVKFLMTRETLPLQRASAWREAEEAAAKSKSSRRLPDVAEALVLWQQIGDLPSVARMQLEQGDVELAAQDFPAARASYEQGLISCQMAGDDRCLAEAANNSGLVARRTGDFETSLSRLRQAAGACQRIGRTDLEGQALSNLGLLFWQTGDYQEAITIFTRAKGLLLAHDRLAYARVANNLGLCYQAMGEYRKSRFNFGQALTVFVALRSQHDAVRAQRNLGRNWLAEGNTSIALPILRQALAEADRISDRSARAECLGAVGQALVAEHRFEEARAVLQQALEIHRATRDRQMEALDLHLLGTAFAGLRQIPVARDYLTQATVLRLQIGLSDPAVDSLVALADLEHAAGNAGGAVDAATRALKIMESVRIQVPIPELRASYYSRRGRLFDLLTGLAALDNSPPSGDAAFLEAERGRGRALIDLLSTGNITSAIPPEVLNSRSSIERQIDLLALRLSTAAPSVAELLRRQVEGLVASREEIEAGIRQAALKEELTAPLKSMEEVRAALSPDTGILEYYLGDGESYLWLVRRNHNTLFFRLPARALIEAESAPVVKLFPRALERRNSPEEQHSFDAALRRLSRTLLGPLGGTELPERLVLVADGVLTRVPFAALPLNGSSRLGVVYDLVQTSSAAYLTVGRKPRALSDFPKTILSVTDPVFSPKDPRVHASSVIPLSTQVPDLARLPFSGETEAVAALVPASRRRTLRGFNANPDTLRAASPGDYAIVQFSTHGFIDDQIPELSRIALSLVGPTGRPLEGFLRPAQFASLHLNGSTVVLSACNTALGKQVVGEGLWGFTASLFQAGAAQLILALSEVDAEGSSAFLAEVYRNMLGEKHASVEHAMTLARRSLARSARWSDPWYWASFAVYGRPREVN